MDNRTIDVTSEGDEALLLAMELIWPNATGGKATHYKLAQLKPEVRYYGEPKTTHHFKSLVVDPKQGTPTLILLWHNEEGATQFPYEMDLKEAYQFVIGWLKRANPGPQPDHDGDNNAGWRLFTEDWGHVWTSTHAIFAIQPAWAMYGK
jgi:hypothetical protein